ncbi:MAG TPA: DegQ family serine endoprotease, partial [Thermodesulfobacteriota bacterium]|nr:DegQ family serine endoprotease [Thermodesulfobacteriota bacterium]
PAASAPQPPAAAPGAAVQTVPSFVALAKAVKPSVVNVQVRGRAAERRGRRELTPPFPFGPFGPRGPRAPVPRQGIGSGFIVSEDGYILTNNHVVEDAEEIVVRLADEREFRARVVGRDPKTDIALIKIDVPGEKLTPVRLGDSDALEVGEWVLAIGNPFGLDHSVTAGIVSAKGRVIGAGPYDDFIQTDAPINPGNSGGPLVNLSGEVVGISTAIVAQGQGVGFAIPINLAKQLLPQLRERGVVSRGWLGVIIQRVTPELARSFRLPEERGALVADVMKGSPAEKAGVQRGDVVIEFNGAPVKEITDLTKLVAAARVGSEARLTVIRDGKRLTLPVTVGEMPGEPTEAAVPRAETRLGMSVQDLTPELARQLEVEGERGVVVTRVEQEGPAARAGIEEGDIIREVNRQPVASVKEFEEALSRSPADAPVLFLVKRDSGAFYLPVERDQR